MIRHLAITRIYHGSDDSPKTTRSAVEMRTAITCQGGTVWYSIEAEKNASSPDRLDQFSICIKIRISFHSLFHLFKTRMDSTRSAIVLLRNTAKFTGEKFTAQWLFCEYQDIFSHPSDRTPPYAITKRVGAPSAWTSPSDLDKRELDGRDLPQGVAPHAHRGVVGAPELCRWLVSDQPPWVPGH